MAPVTRRNPQRPPPSFQHLEVRVYEGEGQELLRKDNKVNMDVNLVNMDENSYSFETSVGTEIKEITWEMKNFKALSRMKDAFKNLSITFDAGRSIKLPTKWIFFIRRDDDDFGLYLRLLEKPIKEKEIFARFDSVVKRVGGGEFARLCTEVVDMQSVVDWGWSSLSTISKLTSPASNVLEDDMLTLSLKLYIYSKQTVNRTENQELVKLKADCEKMIASSLHSSLLSKNYSDVSLKTADGVVFQAHKMILAAHSHVFHAMFTTDMTEKRTGVVSIDDIRSPAFSVLLKFMYSGQVDDAWHEACEEVIYAADKYELILLKSYCDHTLAASCNKENALSLLKLSRLHDLKIATKQISDYIKMNTDDVLKSI